MRSRAKFGTAPAPARKKTIPVPAPDLAPSKMFQRLWFRLRGCEVVQIWGRLQLRLQSAYKKLSTPAPAPSKMSRRLRLRLRIPATSSSRNCLTLFLSGFFNANSVRGGPIRPPLRSRKLRSVETFCKRHWIGCDVISNFCKGHFQVRSILRSPEVTKGQISRKWLFFANIRYYLQKYDS